MKNVFVVLIAIVFGFKSFGQSTLNTKLCKDIDSLFEGYAHYNRFIGSVLVSKDDKVIYQKSFGYAELKGLEKNTKKTIYSIASLTKSLTAVAIMKLIEDGKLSLETPISTYFPDFIPKYSKNITIQHLLNNSSGMQANIGREDESGNGIMPEGHEITFDEVLDKFKDSELKFEPGTGYEYNNFGYLILANIIEKVSGESYDDFMELAVFKPANMRNTTSESSNSSIPSSMAKPYLNLGMDKFKAFNSPLHPSWLKGAANVTSTTGDLFRFMTALDNGKLLKPTSLNMLYTATQSMRVNEMNSGLGWVIDQKGDEKWIYNNGLLPGYASLMGSLPEEKVKIIILSNATTVNPILEEFQGNLSFVNEIGDKVVSIIQGNEVEIVPIEIKNKASLNFSESYKLDNEHLLILKKEGEMYTLESSGKEPWSIFTYTFSRNVNAANETAHFFAKAMSTQKFEGLSDYGNDDLKRLLGSEEGLGQLKGMWSNFLSDAGKFISYNIYKTEGDEVKNVHIRFHFETMDVGIALSINAANKIQGMFIDDALKTSHVSTVKLIPIGENDFFINGHQNGGMQDLKIEVSNNELIIKDSSEVFRAKAAI